MALKESQMYQLYHPLGQIQLTSSQSSTADESTLGEHTFLGMPKHVSQMANSIYRAWLVEGLDLARSLARRIGHSQPWNLGLRRARRDTFLVRGGVPWGRNVVLWHRSNLQFSPGGQEKALWGGVMVLFSARSRGRGEVCRRGRGEGEERREREAGT